MSLFPANCDDMGGWAEHRNKPINHLSQPPLHLIIGVNMKHMPGVYILCYYIWPQQEFLSEVTKQDSIAVYL